MKVEEAEKKWSLEDDESEDEEKPKTDVKKEEESEEEDPLEAYMKSIDAQVTKMKGGGAVAVTTPVSTDGTKEKKTKTITVVKTVVAVAKPAEVEVKPEVIEQNQVRMSHAYNNSRGVNNSEKIPYTI